LEVFESKQNLIQGDFRSNIPSSDSSRQSVVGYIVSFCHFVL
jgi:hypothetical protein